MTERPCAWYCDPEQPGGQGQIPCVCVEGDKAADTAEERVTPNAATV